MRLRIKLLIKNGKLVFSPNLNQHRPAFIIGVSDNKMTELRKAFKLSILMIIVSLNSVFGNINHQLSNDTLNSDYRLLTDSLSNLEFGENCGFVGDIQPKGREAITNLILDHQYSLIRSVLDGNNDEGRVYAIEALLELNIKGDIELTEIEKQKTKNIIEEDFELDRCLGCESETTYSLLLFMEDKFKRLLELNEIKLNYR